MVCPYGTCIPFGFAKRGGQAAVDLHRHDRQINKERHSRTRKARKAGVLSPRCNRRVDLASKPPARVSQHRSGGAGAVEAPTPPDVRSEGGGFVYSGDRMKASLAHLSPQDVQAFRKLGISEELLELAHVQRVTDAEAREKFGILFDGDLRGVVFP